MDGESNKLYFIELKFSVLTNHHKFIMVSSAMLNSQICTQYLVSSTMLMLIIFYIYFRPSGLFYYTA